MIRRRTDRDESPCRQVDSGISPGLRCRNGELVILCRERPMSHEQQEKSCPGNRRQRGGENRSTLHDRNPKLKNRESGESRTDIFIIHYSCPGTRAKRPRLHKISIHISRCRDSSASWMRNCRARPVCRQDRYRFGCACTRRAHHSNSARSDRAPTK